MATITPARTSAVVPHDPDDPAIWVSRTPPDRALIFGTDKVDGVGGLYAFGLDGEIRQAITPLDRPNNVDVEYGLAMGGREIDIAVLTEGRQHRLRVYGIPPDGGLLTDLAPAGIPVLDGQEGEAAEPMGIALYKRAADRAIFAIVAPKTAAPPITCGNTGSREWLVTSRRPGPPLRRLQPERSNPRRKLARSKLSLSTTSSGSCTTGDERYGIRKYHADPDVPEAARELAAFGLDGYHDDREGLAIYKTGERTGYIVSSDQLIGGSRLVIFPREGTAADVNAHPAIAVVQTAADETDGLDVTSAPLPGFPAGLLVMMNSTPRNFQLYDWTTLVRHLPGSSNLTSR